MNSCSTTSESEEYTFGYVSIYLINSETLWNETKSNDFKGKLFLEVMITIEELLN